MSLQTKTVLKSETVTVSGSDVVRGVAGSEAVLSWNIAGPVTGAGATIVFTIAEVDPTDETTVVGSSAASVPITAASAGRINLPLILSPTVKVSWTVTGSSPSFGGTSLTLSSKPSSSVVTGPLGITGPVRVDRVGITGFVQVTGPVGVTGQVAVVGAVGVTGPVRVDSVGVTGPVRVDSVGGTGPFRVDRVGVTGPVFVAGFGSAGSPTAGILSVQGVSGAQPHPVVGAAPAGLPAAGNPVLVAGQGGDGSVRVPAVLNAQPTGAEYGMVVRGIERTAPSYYAFFDRIAPAANKYMATLFNTSSTRKVVVQRILRLHTRETGAGGVNLDQYVARITARVAGTAVTVRSDDTSDAVSSGISADTNSTVVVEDHIIRRLFAHAEAIDLTNTALLNMVALGMSMQVIYERKEGMRGITLRQNQGVTVRNVTSSTAGNVSYVFEFTDEVA